jgi:hypothetical protein
VIDEFAFVSADIHFDNKLTINEAMQQALEKNRVASYYIKII